MKALISCAVTAQLICTFLFAYARTRFSHDAAQLSASQNFSEGFYHIFDSALQGFEEELLTVKRKLNCYINSFSRFSLFYG